MQKKIIFELINHVNEAESVIESFVSSSRLLIFRANKYECEFRLPNVYLNMKSLTKGFVIDNCACIKLTVHQVE